jgi:hypothetical protein
MLTKFSPHIYRKHVIIGSAAFVAIAGVGAYLIVPGNAQTTSASDLHTPTPTASSQATLPFGRLEFITSAVASMSPTAKPKAKVTHSARPSASSDPSTVYNSDASSRSPYTWPFSWNSIWNMPIASTAQYTPGYIKSDGTSETAAGDDYDSTNPSFPAVTLENARLANGSTGSVGVYGDPDMTADGEWNTCSAFLGTDNSSVYQGETTELSAGGNPYFGGSDDVAWAPVSIEGPGTTGCHGGSGLSGLGGTLTLNDITQSGPITHVLKVALDGSVDYSSANGGFRWPALNADGGYTDSSNINYYGGSNPNVQEGSLLALPTSISPSSFSNPMVAKIAQAMQDYGSYIVDTTATGGYDISTLIANYNASSTLLDDICGSSCNASSFDSQLNTLFQELDVVSNNTPSTPGGGAVGASRCAPYAPKFDDGSDAPPAVQVVNC